MNPLVQYLANATPQDLTTLDVQIAACQTQLSQLQLARILLVNSLYGGQVQIAAPVVLLPVPPAVPVIPAPPSPTPPVPAIEAPQAKKPGVKPGPKPGFKRTKPEVTPTSQAPTEEPKKSEPKPAKQPGETKKAIIEFLTTRGPHECAAIVRGLNYGVEDYHVVYSCLVTNKTCFRKDIATKLWSFMSPTQADVVEKTEPEPAVLAHEHEPKITE